LGPIQHQDLIIPDFNVRPYRPPITGNPNHSAYQFTPLHQDIPHILNPIQVDLQNISPQLPRTPLHRQPQHTVHHHMIALTLDSLLPPVRIAVDRLCSSATQLARPSFIPDTDAVVAAIARISASIPREHKDTHIERYLHYNRYRPMVAALCSLITSAKLAAGDWSPEPQIRKMERDAMDVLAKAETFLEYARTVADIHPRRIKPFFMMSPDGDGTTGGGWTNNLNDASSINRDHLELLWAEMETEKDAIEKCVKAMALPSQGSSRGRKNSVVIVDDHLTIPFVLISVQVSIPVLLTDNRKR